MKRSLLMSVCAASLAVVMFTSSAQAVVDVALNLRYTHPNVPSQGGTWELVAKTNDAGGIAGLSAVLTGINTSNLNFVGAGHSIDPVNQFVDYGNGAFNVVYGQNLAPVVNGVGTGAGSPGNRATDPLRNPAWDNVAVLITGTFGSTRPGFGTSPTGKVTEANVFSGTTAVAGTIGLTNVRGDSVIGLGLETPAGAGLRVGDLNRDGLVTLSNDVFPALARVGQAGPFGWDQGDFSGNGIVTLSTDIFPALASVGAAAPPAPAITAVPEPTSLALLSLVASMGLLMRRRA